MQIHHATLKAAEKAGIALSADEEGQFLAVHSKTNRRMRGGDPKMLVKDMTALIELHQRYSSATATQDNDGWIVTSPWGEFRALYLTDAVSRMKRAFAEHHQPEDEEEEAELEQEETEAEEEQEAEHEESGGDVVGAEYRARYAEAGHPRHCGDWLAVTLNEMVGETKHLNVEALDRLAQLNGIDVSKYNRTNLGWQGRLRMTFRNLLARKIWNRGFIINFNEEAIEAPKDWIDSQRFKK